MFGNSALKEKFNKLARGKLGPESLIPTNMGNTGTFSLDSSLSFTKEMHLLLDRPQQLNLLFLVVMYSRNKQPNIHQKLKRSTKTRGLYHP